MSLSTRHRPRFMRAARGFILPLTLWMVAIVGLLASIINVWVGRAVANSQALTRRVEMELTQSDIRNELVYLLARRPTSYRGLEVGPTVTLVAGNDLIGLMSGPVDSGRALRLDGRAYTVAEHPNLIIKVQDASGLLNLNTMMPPNVRRTLAGLGLPETEVNRMTDTLLDYLDEDDLTRLAGAEKTQYDRLNLPPPANANLTTPYEAQRILGWGQLDALWKSDMENPILTTCLGGALNLNTAPVAALMANIAGLTREKAEQAVARREERPFRGTREFGAAADVLITDEPFLYSFNPGSCMLVDVIDKLTGQHTRFSLTLDRISQLRPWRIDYAIRIPSADRTALDQLKPEGPFPTPESVDLPADGDPAAALRQ
ncbi:MAG: general secretion pathway protein GspK [Rhodospirillaceae bacterium]|nr:general secretion pathway protein GspK [Rhodospirillaceae bacterium]